MPNSDKKLGQLVANLGAAIRERRQAKNLSQEALAEIADFDRTYVSLHSFWQNYPPEERGRSPRGDQFPWIEVGEHSVGFKLDRILSQQIKIWGTWSAIGRVLRAKREAMEILQAAGTATLNRTGCWF